MSVALLIGPIRSAAAASGGPFSSGTGPLNCKPCVLSARRSDALNIEYQRVQRWRSFGVFPDVAGGRIFQTREIRRYGKLAIMSDIGRLPGSGMGASS
jgi:hypothetical protein